MRAALLASLALASLGCGRHVHPRACTVSAITKGPWTNRVDATHLALRWESRSPGCVEATLVAPGGEERIVRGAATAAEVKSSFDNGGVTDPDLAGTFYMAEIEVDGLTPGTCYGWRVRDPAGGRAGRACTAREPGAPFTFLAIGDTNPALGHTAGVLEHTLPANPDFVVHVGDLQYYSSILETWQYWFEHMEPMLAAGGFFPCIGNHEFEDVVADEFDDYYLRLFATPSPQRDGSRLWYHFEWGGVSFFALDSEDDLSASSEQAEWLQAGLAGAELIPGHRFSVIYLHRPVYTLGDSAPRLDLRAVLAQIIQGHAVPLVLQGHMHGYERFEVGPVTYVTTAGGGGQIGDVNANVANYPDDVPLRVAVAPLSHAMLFDVTAGKLSGRAVGEDGAVIDSFEKSVP